MARVEGLGRVLLSAPAGQTWRHWPGVCPLDPWAKPHAHLLRPDGSPGIVVAPLAEVVAQQVEARALRPVHLHAP